MLQADIEILLRASLLRCFADYGVAIPVISLRQETHQGVQDGVYFHHIGTQPHGWQGRSYNWPDPKMTEGELHGETYQIGAVRGRDPQDWCRLARMACQTLAFVEYMRAGGVGVQRASPIRSVPYVDDSGQYADNPSFDIVLTHYHTLTPSVEYADPVTMDLHRI